MVIHIDSINVEKPHEINIELGNMNQYPKLNSSKINLTSQQQDQRENDKFFENFENNTHQGNSGPINSQLAHLDTDTNPNSGKINMTYFVHKLLSKRGTEYNMKIANFKNATLEDILNQNQFESFEIKNLNDGITSQNETEHDIKNLPHEFLKVQEIEIENINDTDVRFNAEGGGGGGGGGGGWLLNDDSKTDAPQKFNFETETETTFYDITTTDDTTYDNMTVNETNAHDNESTDYTYYSSYYETSGTGTTEIYDTTESESDDRWTTHDKIGTNDSNDKNNSNDSHDKNFPNDLNDKVNFDPTESDSLTEVNQDKSTNCNSSLVNYYVTRENCSMSSNYIEDFCSKYNMEKENREGIDISFYQFHEENEARFSLNSSNVEKRKKCCEITDALFVANLMVSFMKTYETVVSKILIEKTNLNGWDFLIEDKRVSLKNNELERLKRNHRSSAKVYFIKRNSFKNLKLNVF